jgi:hypothetical protein
MRRGLMNTRRTGSLNCRITLLPGTRRRSSRSVEDQFLDRGRVPGSNNTMRLRGRGDLFPLTVGCQNPGHPTQNGRPKFRFPLNQHTTKEVAKHKEAKDQYEAIGKRLESIEREYFALTGTDIRQTFTETEVHQAFDALMKRKS